MRVEDEGTGGVAATTASVPSSSGVTNSASGEGGGVTTASAGSGGNDASGGAGGDPVHDPVPGCEQLVWVGEPTVVPRHQGRPGARVFALDGDDVGLVHADQSTGPTRLVSRTIRQPFSSWPPRIDPPVTVYEGNDVMDNGAVPVPSRRDGSFARYVSGGSIVSRVGDAATSQTDGIIVALDPAGDGGAYQLRFNDADDVLIDRLPSLSGELAPTPLGVVPVDGCYLEAAFVQSQGPLLMATGACGGQVLLLRATSLYLEALGVVSAPDSYHVHLIRRTDGAWLATTQVQGITVQPIDGRGAVTGSAWSSTSYYGVVQMTSWREGFAYVESTGGFGDDDTHGVWLHVSDGVNATTLAPWPDDAAVIRDVSVTASADGASLLVAHDVAGDIVLQRADCVSARR